jgi:hypothetical protein
MFRHRIRIIAVAIIVLVAMLGYTILAPGVRVSIRNTGKERMKDVTIRVTGRSYDLSDIAPGASQTERISPEAESQVEVEFTGEGGSKVKLVAAGHLQPASRGQIEIEVKDGRIVGMKNEVGTGIFRRP